MTTIHRLSALRSLMQKHKVNGYIIPSGDAHSSEYIAPIDGRREYISGFSGSAGVALVTETNAYLWTDGRYFLQAEKQLDPSQWTLMKMDYMDTPTLNEYLKKNYSSTSAVVGIDPKLISWSSYSEKKDKLGINIQLIEENLIDLVWNESQPKRPSHPILVLEEKYSGCGVDEKIQKIKNCLKDCDSLILTALDEIAWAFNLRGSDIPYNPVFFSYAIIEKKEQQSSTIYLNKNSLDDKVRLHLESFKVSIKDYEDIFADLEGKKDFKYLISQTCNTKLVQSIRQNSSFVVDKSPVESLKAIKNPVEIEGFRQCHIRDGVALCRYFSWLERSIAEGKSISEYEGAEKLEYFRSLNENFRGLSFDTISSVGPNAAVIHYKVEKESAKIIDNKHIYLCDSGGQYLDGTTDTTRTMHFGTPTDMEKETFTLVLAGHIELDTAIFPQGTTGYQLDILARMPLFRRGLNYRHGTGHGVGHFLNVHEGPQGISSRISNNSVALQPGMTLSNEPGYYEDFKFGIRIEDVVVVVVKELKYNFGNSEYYGFENFTVVPIQKKLIEKKLLTEEQVEWVNNYHARVLDVVGNKLKNVDKEAYEWLKLECLPI